ncbi:hypothetical protein F5X68DRAFT_10739 [Plectosphaerella plurivora]|uniref:Uncharacterized protein n=1 Tax=Plectosphaerella plurivora TaxID=936078 RepID=A0A9P8VC92_9PEZI|nr:hypothetical protein F5X68DRAFT_10739 [Plectosphaerella plurivora]
MANRGLGRTKLGYGRAQSMAGHSSCATSRVSWFGQVRAALSRSRERSAERPRTFQPCYLPDCWKTAAWNGQHRRAQAARVTGGCNRPPRYNRTAAPIASPLQSIVPAPASAPKRDCSRCSSRPRVPAARLRQRPECMMLPDLRCRSLQYSIQSLISTLQAGPSVLDASAESTPAVWKRGGYARAQSCWCFASGADLKTFRRNPVAGSPVLFPGVDPPAPGHVGDPKFGCCNPAATRSSACVAWRAGGWVTWPGSAFRHGRQTRACLVTEGGRPRTQRGPLLEECELDYRMQRPWSSVSIVGGCGATFSPGTDIFPSIPLWWP